MADLYESFRALRINGLDLADLGTHPVWQDAAGVTHLRRACRPDATSADVDAKTLQALAVSGSTCPACGQPEGHNGPWGAALYLARAVVRTVVMLRRIRTTTDGTPVDRLPFWLKVCVKASNVATGQCYRLLLDQSGDGVPEQAHGALKRWLDAAITAAQAGVDAQRAKLHQDQPLELACWRYVPAAYAPLVPDEYPGDAKAAKAAGRTWCLQLSKGDSPRMARAAAVAKVPTADRQAFGALVADWQSAAQAVIDASLAGPWHDVAIEEPRGIAGVSYNTNGTPRRRTEDRHFVFAYFPGTHLVEQELTLVTVPSVVAAAFSPTGRYAWMGRPPALATDLGPHPVFPTPEHLAVAMRLRLGGGRLKDVTRAADTAKVILTPPLAGYAQAA